MAVLEVSETVLSPSVSSLGMVASKQLTLGKQATKTICFLSYIVNYLGFLQARCTDLHRLALKASACFAIVDWTAMAGTSPAFLRMHSFGPRTLTGKRAMITE